MELNTAKIDQAVLALLWLGKHEGERVWKAFDWEAMGRLHAKGYITDPVGKADVPQNTRREWTYISVHSRSRLW